MHKSFVLRRVTEPPKLVMASFEGTVLSLLLFLSIGFVSYSLLGLSLSFSSILAIMTLVLTQGLMIYKSYQDPFFFTVWMAGLSCKKTINVVKLKGNVYGD